MASSVVGPASVMRCSRCRPPSGPGGAAPRRTGLRSAGTGWRSRSCTAARRTSRRWIWPRDGCAPPALAPAFRRRGIGPLAARRAGARSPRSETWRRSAATAARRRRDLPGSLMAKSTTFLLPGRVATWRAYWSGTNTCSSSAASCASPNMPRVLTLVSRCLRSPTPCGQRLHLAQALVHLLQPLGHLLEALAQARVQRGLQLFVHGGAHLVELGGIGLLQLRQLRFQRGAHLGHAPRVGFAQSDCSCSVSVSDSVFCSSASCCAEGIDLGVLGARGFGALLHQRLLEGGQVLRQLQCARRATTR